MDILIGKVTHYYDRIGVAIVNIQNQSLHKDDHIKFSGHDQEFTQKVESMQVEHQNVNQADKGMIVGIKVDKKVKKGDQVYLINE